MDAPAIAGCRSIENYEKLNRIDEGTYGVVYRAKDKSTGEIVALKRLKLEREKYGFPVTSLREIQALLVSKHPNIVNVREIAVGRNGEYIYIVMDFIEHDLKALMKDMPSPFLQSEVKTILKQLLSAMKLLHEHWIVHRDLKTSNLLLTNQGQIKVADFGLAKKFGSPLGDMTQEVVTLWYRAPELFMGTTEYSTAIDMWSIGCIFAELILNKPLFDGRLELDMLAKIFNLLGTPTRESWPDFSLLPHASKFTFKFQPGTGLRTAFPYLTKAGVNLMSRLLCLDPSRRISASEALLHPYFTESPKPKDPSMFPTWPSRGSMEKRKTYQSPSAPHANYSENGLQLKNQIDEAALAQDLVFPTVSDSNIFRPSE